MLCDGAQNRAPFVFRSCLDNICNQLAHENPPIGRYPPKRPTGAGGRGGGGGSTQAIHPPHHRATAVVGVVDIHPPHHRGAAVVGGVDQCKPSTPPTTARRPWWGGVDTYVEAARTSWRLLAPLLQW